MASETSFETVSAQIRACRLCVEAPRGRPLPHAPRPVFRGTPSARILVAGQAPGTRVHASGMPFTDPSGVRLRAWMGVDEKTFYDERRIAVVPMGFCFPGQDAKGGDRPPRRECAPTWHDRLMPHFAALGLVLPIGAYALRYHLGRLGLGSHLRPSLTETLLGWRAIFAASTAPRVLVMPHPSWRNTAWLKRNPWFEADLLPVLRGEVARLLL
jgi:uracil-DNA glycosylase